MMDPDHMRMYCLSCEMSRVFTRIAIKDGIEYWRCGCTYMVYLPEVTLA